MPRQLSAFVLFMFASASGTFANAQGLPPLPSPLPSSAGQPTFMVPDHLKVTITGDPADADFVRAALRGAVERAIGPTLAPGGTVTATQTLPATERLDRGFLTTFEVTVRIDPGAGERPIARTIAVDVDNLSLPPLAPATLSFKDDPERITGDGVLSRTRIGMGQPARIYYYHQNLREPRRFCVALTANDSVATRVQVVSATSGPNIDVMSVGHATTNVFLARQPHQEGTVIDIAGGKPVLLRDTAIGPGDVIVGATDLRVLSGGPVTATVMAIPPGADPPAYLYAAKLPDDGHDRHGVFDLRDVVQPIIAYSAGGPDVTYTYGSRRNTVPNIDPADNGHDYGDYGVLHHVTFDLANPELSATTVYLYEKPLGGDVRGTFLVNDMPVEVGCVRVAQPYLISSEQLAPHATGTFDVLTMTDGGSNYPLQLGVSTTPPLPAAPPISAADGCFPKPGGAPAAAQPARAPSGH